MDDWDLLPSFCPDVKSRRCEDLASCNRSPALAFLSGELLLVSILMKRGHLREGRAPRPFIWMDIWEHISGLIWNSRALSIGVPDRCVIYVLSRRKVLFTGSIFAGNMSLVDGMWALKGLFLCHTNSWRCLSEFKDFPKASLLFFWNKAFSEAMSDWGSN